MNDPDEVDHHDTRPPLEADDGARGRAPSAAEEVDHTDHVIQADAPPPTRALCAPAPAPALTFSQALDALSDRQQTYVWHYLEDPVGARAAAATGYSAANASATAMALHANPNVVRAIALGRAELRAALAFDHVEWLQELLLVMRADVTSFRFDDEGAAIKEPGREHEWRAVRAIKRDTRKARDGSVTHSVRVELHPKLEAARLLGQATGLLSGEAAEELPAPPEVKGVDVRDVLG